MRVIKNDVPQSIAIQLIDKKSADKIKAIMNDRPTFMSKLSLKYDKLFIRLCSMIKSGKLILVLVNSITEEEIVDFIKQNEIFVYDEKEYEILSGLRDLSDKYLLGNGYESIQNYVEEFNDNLNRFN